jgi:hypothetical protein
VPDGGPNAATRLLGADTRLYLLTKRLLKRRAEDAAFDAKVASRLALLAKVTDMDSG